MGREAQHIDAERLYIEIQVARRLHGVRMESDSVSMLIFRLADCGGNLGNRLDCAGLVVDVHDGDDGCFGGDGLGHFLRGDDSIDVRLEIGDGKSRVAFQPFTGMNDSVVLAGGGDDVAAVLFEGVGCAADGHVVGVGATAGEDYVAIAGVEDAGDLVTGGVDGAGGVLPQPVDAGGVAVLPGEVGEHRLNDAGINGRGGRMIKVDGHEVLSPSVGEIARII